VSSRKPRREKGMLKASSRRETEAAVTPRCFRDEGPIRSLHIQVTRQRLSKSVPLSEA